jgi:hypothetical protein
LVLPFKATIDGRWRPSSAYLYFYIVSYTNDREAADMKTPILGYKIAVWFRREDRTILVVCYNLLVTFRFWPIQLADLFSNLSWLIQDDTNLKLFQDCAKLKSALLWLDSPITWESTHYLRGIVLWRLYRKTMSLYRMCAREMASFYFSIFEPFNERWFHFQ